MDLLNLKTNLIPELQEYVTLLDTSKQTLLALRHPLVYSVPYFPNLETDNYLNKCFKAKLQHIEESLKDKNYSSYLWMHERPYRLEAFLKIQSYLEDKDYWKYLADLFVDTENLHQNRITWVKLLSSKRSNKEYLMTEQERKYLENLPETLRVYRGVSHPKQKISTGLSFTLDKDKAFWFANRWGRKGQVYTSEIRKQKAVAYFSERGESEIVILPRTRMKMELVLPST